MFNITSVKKSGVEERKRDLSSNEMARGIAAKNRELNPDFISGPNRYLANRMIHCPHTHTCETACEVLNRTSQPSPKKKSSILKSAEAKEQFAKFKKCYLDILFILDATSSMQPWIDLAKTNIQGQAVQARKAYEDRQATLRYGVVCYRDICDGKR